MRLVAHREIVVAAELKKGGRFPKLLVHMCAIGEQSGQLDNMLLRAAAAFESEVNAVITHLRQRWLFGLPPE